MEGYSLSRARCYRWLLGLVLLGRTVAQDNTQPTPEELACWEEYNGGAYYNPTTSACEVCSAGQYDHDAISNMPNMNRQAMVITWWDGVTDWNPAATACVDCEQGQFAPFEETTHMCYPCGVGQYSTGGPAAEGEAYVGCVACTIGQADHDSDASTTCIPCAEGTFSRGESTSCRDCAAGFVDEDLDPTTECTACAAGYFSAGSDDAAYDGTNPEVYATVCAICEAGQADLDGEYDNDADGHCATGTDYDPHNPGDYVAVDTQQDCHGTCSLPILLPTHSHTEAACLALGECFDTDGVTPLAWLDTRAECEGRRPVPGRWVSAGAEWTPSGIEGAENNRWHSPFCATEDGTFMEFTEENCVAGSGSGSGLYWHEEVFYSASTPCISCVPGRYQVAGDITCLQCEPGFTTDSLASSGGTTCTPVPPGFYDHDSAVDGDSDGYCRDLDGEYVYLDSEGACLFTGNTWDGATSICTSGQDGQPIDGVVTEAECEESGFTWNADEIFYSSTTAPQECDDGSTADLRCVEAAPLTGGASVEDDAIACAAVDVTAATAAEDCAAAASGACAYTREGGQGLSCTPAPVGYYDHDLLSTTAPLPCPNGYTTNSLGELGATGCTPAPLGEYDHDGLSTTPPIECGDGFTTECSAGFTGDPEAVQSCVEAAASCVETASVTVPADAANCGAVSGLDLATSTACDAVLLTADGTTPACTYTSVAEDATACAAVDLGAATPRADCRAVRTAADADVAACVYTPPPTAATCVDWSVGDMAATGCTAVAQGFYDHDRLSYTSPLECVPGHIVGGCIRAECRDSGGALVLAEGTEALVDTAEDCSAASETNTFDQNAMTSCSNTNYIKATTCTPVVVGSYDDDGDPVTPAVPCLKGSTTDTLDQPGAATCDLVPPGYYDHDSDIDGAPFCTDLAGDFLYADIDAIRPSELYCEVSGATVTIVNPPGGAEVTVGEIRISSLAGLANPTGAFVGNFVQQEAQGEPFTLHAAAEYTQYLDYNFYETAGLYKLQGGSQTFQTGLDYPVGPLHGGTGDIVCLALAPDGTEIPILTFEVTQSEVDCVAVAGSRWSRHETFQSSTTSPEQCPPGSTTDTEVEAGAIACTEAPAGEFDHDSICHEVTGYCEDDYASCVNVDIEAHCSFTWQVNPYDPALESWCMDGDGDPVSPVGLHASEAACETFYTCDGTVASDAGAEFADVIGQDCQQLYADASSAVASSGCQVSGCTLSAAQSTGNQYVETGCYQGAVLRTVQQICDALPGHTWLPSVTFYSSTTPSRNCGASRDNRFLGAVVGGSTTYTEDGFLSDEPAGTSTGATRCEAAPPGEYDHDTDPTTGPIECPSGYTTDTRAEPGAITCVPAKIGFYDHDLSSTTIPVVCAKGSNTYLPTGVAAVLTEGATICSRVPPGLYDHDSANDQIYRGTEGAAGWGYCSEADGSLTLHVTELTCAVSPATCTGTAGDGVTDCSSAFSEAADDTANSCPSGCDYAPEGDTGRIWHAETRFYSSTTLPAECAAGSTTTYPSDDGAQLDGATGCVSAPAGLYDHDSAEHGTSHTSDGTCTGMYREFTHGVDIHGAPLLVSCEETFVTAGDGLPTSCPAECIYETEHFCVSPLTIDYADTECSGNPDSCSIALSLEYIEETSNTAASCTGAAETPTCEYSTGTEGCPFGCSDDGTTCSGFADTPTCDLLPSTDGRVDCPAGCTFESAAGCTGLPATCYAANGVDEVSDVTDEISCEYELSGQRWSPDLCTGTIPAACTGTAGDGVTDCSSAFSEAADDTADSCPSGCDYAAGEACDAAYAGTTSAISPAQGGRCSATASGDETGCTFTAASCSDGVSVDEFSCELQRTDRQWAAYHWAPGVFYSSITPPVECADGSTTDTLAAPGAVACTAAPPGKYDEDRLATTAPLECGHGAPVVCTANFDGTGGRVACDETKCTTTGNTWSTLDSKCRNAAGAIQGAATCTGTATDTAATPDCGLAFATAGDGLPDSCVDGCTYREPFDQNACVYTGHVWDADTNTCSDVSGRGYCQDANGDRMVESMTSHDWHDQDLCESVTGRTWVWNQYRGFQTDTLAAAGATECLMCPAGRADTDRTSTTACSACDPGETTMRCTDANGDIVAAVSDTECTGTPTCGDFTVAEGCPPGCDNDGTLCTGTASAPTTLWQPRGATSCLLCPAGDYDDDGDPSTVCIECDDGGTTYTLDTSGEPTVLAAQGATRCIAAPAGEYDHDGVATTLPLECGDGSTDDDSNDAGFTTNTLSAGGATGCIPAPPGTYDHDSRSTTAPEECGDGADADGSNQAGYATDALARCVLSEECVAVPGTVEQEASESTTCDLVAGVGCTVLTGQGSCNYIITDVQVALAAGFALGLPTGYSYDPNANVGERCLNAAGDVVYGRATEARCLADPILSQSQCETQSTGRTWSACTDTSGSVVDAATLEECEQTGNAWDGTTSQCTDATGSVLVETCTGTASGDAAGFTCDLDSSTDDIATCPAGCDHYEPPTDETACTATGNTFGSQHDCYDLDGTTVTSDLDEATCEVEASPYTWRLQSGASSCTACAAGFADLDRLSVTSCESCPVGTTTVRANQDGTSTIDTAATVCTFCSDGSYDHDMTATTPCFNCNAGKYGSGADAECGDCPAGLYDHDRSSTTPCRSCLLGQHSVAGQTYCDDCPRGEHDHDMDPATPCIDCAEGQFAPQRSVACVDCEAGYADTDQLAATECEMCRPGQYSAQRGVTCASCEKGQTDLDGQVTQDLYLGGRLPLVAGRCIAANGYTLETAVADELTCVGTPTSPTGRTWTTPTPQCLTNWVTGTCTRASGNTWTEPDGPCVDSNLQEVAVTRPGETLSSRLLKAACTQTAVPIRDEAGCLAEEATWNVYEYCAPAQTSPDETDTWTSDTDEFSCESQSTGNTFVAAHCSDAGGDTTAHATEQLCEYDPTGNSWDANAAVGAECLGSDGQPVSPQPADETACVQQDSGRTWTADECFAADNSLLPDLTTQSDCLYTASGNSWFPGICMRNDMLTWMEEIVDGAVVDVLDEATCDLMQADCTAITAPWYRVGAYLAERDDMCRTGGVVQGLTSVNAFALQTCNGAVDHASTHSVSLEAACTAMTEIIDAAVAADTSHPCANAAALCDCVFTPAQVPSASTPCVQCANGRYTDRLFFGECDECDYGRFDHDEDPSTTCEDCYEGQYSDTGQTECSHCAGGKHDHDRNPATECVTCNPGYFSALITHKVCTTAAGDIWDLSHIAEPEESDCINDLRPDNVWSVYVTGAAGENGCIGCDYGTADVDSDAATPCRECRPGQYAPRLSAACTDCPVGYGDDDLDPATPCVLCRVGMFAPPGATNCTGCPQGKHDGDFDSTTACDDCLPGQFSDSGWTNCTNCTAGFADEDQDPSTPCDACALGQYTPEFSIICVDCLSFEYDNDSNPATPCALCDEGHHTNGLACISCAAGLFDDDADPATECESCMIGQFSPLEAVSCTDCAAGAHDHDRDPGTACELCGPGNFSALGDLFCFPCRPGTYDNDTDASTPCVSCPSGQFSDAGAVECIDCAAGRIDIDFDPATPCVACPPGSYAGAGATVCIMCAAGEIDHDQDPATECSECEPGKHSALGDYKCDACFTGFYDADGSAATPCTPCDAGQFSSGVGRCTAGSTDLFTYFQWSAPLPQTEAECTITSNSNVWSASSRCVDTDGETTLPTVSDEDTCTAVAGRVWTIGCFSSDGLFLPARTNRQDCTTDPNDNLWVVAFPGLCDAHTDPVRACRNEVSTDTGITQECFDAIGGSSSASAFVQSQDTCIACPADEPADVCAACETDVLAALARCAPTGAAEHSACVIPTVTDLDTCEIKSSNNVWTVPVCRTAPTTNTWGGDPPVCTDDQNTQTAATSEAECVGNAPVTAVDETECEIEATGRTWIEGWCNDYARCRDMDGSVASDFTTMDACEITSTGNTWNPTDVLPTGVAAIDADANTVNFANAQIGLEIGQALQLGHNVPTCDLDAATDGTGDCPTGCVFTDTTTPVCQFEDATAFTGCPIGCDQDLTQGAEACTGDALPLPATCVGTADTKTCAATVGVDLIISNVQGAQVTFSTDILAGDPNALENCHISKTTCTSASGSIVDAGDDDECELMDSGRTWITPRVAGVTDETTCEWEATGYTWDDVGTCHLRCAYTQGTEGCPEGCRDDGTTCTGETDELHPTIASEAECWGSCTVTPGTSQQETIEATTCTLDVGSCTVSTGSGSCAYVTSVETVWRVGQCWDGASTVSATDEDDCEIVQISPARTWVEPYCNDADGNQLSSGVAGTERICELAASGNVWSEGFCTAPAESLNPVWGDLAVASIDDTTNAVTLASVEVGISPGEVLHISSASGHTCQASPLDTDLIVGSVNGAVITFEEATFASADGEVTAGDAAAAINCIILRLLFADQVGCEEMPTGNTWWHPYTYCDNCPSGSFDDDLDPTTPCLGCIAGEYSPGRTSSCVDCEPGFVDADSSPGTVCTACTSGQYSGDRATVCLDCLAGEKDGDYDPSTPCIACNAGQFAAVASTRCITCEAGQADLDSDPATECTSCPAGKHAASGSTGCAACPAGRVDHDSDASTSCEACVAGQYAPEGETTCSSCAAGRHDDDTDPGTPCVACSPGTETLTQGRCLDENDVEATLNAGANDEQRCESIRNTNTWTPAACTRNSDSSPVVATDETDCTIDITGAHFFTASFCTRRDGTIVNRGEAACIAAGDSYWTAAGCGDEREVVQAVGTCEHVLSTDVCPCERRDSGASWAEPFCEHGTTGAVLAGFQDSTACELQATPNEWRAGFCSNNADNSLVQGVTSESICETEPTGRLWDGVGVCVDVADPNVYYARTESVCQMSADSNWVQGRCWADLLQSVSAINADAETVTTAIAATSVSAGMKLQLADAPGASCLATPLNTDLEVQSRSGSTITFVTGSITAGDAAAATNCVLRAPVTAADQADCEDTTLPRTWTDPSCYDENGLSLVGTVANNDIESCTIESSGHIWNDGLCTKADLSLDTDATDEYSCLVEVTDNMEFSAGFCTLTDGTQSERTRADCQAASDSVWTYGGCSDARSPTGDDEASCFQQDRPNTWHAAVCEDENSVAVTPTPETDLLCKRDPTGNRWQPVGSYCADCVAGRADVDSDGGSDTSCDACPSGTYAPVRSTACEPCPSGTYDNEPACTSNTGAAVVADTEAKCLGSCTVVIGTSEQEAAEATTCALSVGSCSVATGSGSCVYEPLSNTWFLTASTPCVACAIGRAAVDAVTNCDACGGGSADVDSVYGGNQPHCLDPTGQYVDPVDMDLCELEATGSTWIPAGCVDVDGAAVPAAADEAACELTGNTWDGATCTGANGISVDAVDYDECTTTGNAWHSARCVSDPSATSEADCETQPTGRTWVPDARCIDTDGSTVATEFSDQSSCDDSGRTWTEPGCIRADGTPLTPGELCVLLSSHSWVDSVPFYSASTPCVQCPAGQVTIDSCVESDGVSIVPANDRADCETSDTGNTWDGTICRDAVGEPASGSDQESCELQASDRYWGATGCSQCLAGTADTDSNAATACEICVAGRYAAANSVACEECAPGRFSSDPSVPCADCGAGEYAAAGATVCAACDTGFEDDDSDPSTPCTDIDECLANPCQNGATCSDSSSDESVAVGAFDCACASGFTGALCETDNGNPVITESEVSCNDVSTPVDTESRTASVAVSANSITIGDATVTIDFVDNVMAATCKDPGTVCADSTTGACPPGCAGTEGACTGTATCELGVGGQADDCPTVAGCVYVAAPTVAYALAGGGPVGASSEFDVSTRTTVFAVVTDGAGNTGTCEFVVTVFDDEAPVMSLLPPASIAADTDDGQPYATNGVGAFLPTLSATDYQSNPITDVPEVVGYVGACETSDGSPLPGNDESACISETSIVSTGYSWEPGGCAYTNDPEHPATPDGGEAECNERADMFWTNPRCLNGETLVDAATEEDCTTEVTNNEWKPLAVEVDDSTQFPIGQTVVTFVAIDRADLLDGVDAPNTFQATTVVDVTDNQDPTIPVGRCVDITVGTDPGKVFATVAVALDGGVDIVPQRYGDDNSGENLPVVATLDGAAVNANRWDGTVCTDPSGDTVAAASEAECVTQFVLGVNTVTYTTTDAADNVGTCTFDVTVQDLEVPTIDSATCADISATTDPGEAYGSTAFDVPSEYPTLVATDNQVAAEDLVVKSFVERCVAGVASLADCRAIADGFTWDSAALTCTEDATSTEVDPSFCYHSRALQWSGSAEQLSTGTDGVCLQLAHSDQEACESDSNLPSPSWEWVEVTALTRFPIGNTELALVVSDGFNAANTVSGVDACRLTLTVVDDEAPAISCGSDPTGTTAPGESFGTIGTGSVILPSATAVDNDAASISYETAPTCSDPACAGHLCQEANCPSPGVWYAGGDEIADDYQFSYTGTSGTDATTVVYVATDGAGNEDRCSITVRVNDNEAPSIECPAAISIEADVADSWVNDCGAGGANCVSGQEPGSARIYGLIELPELASVSDNSGETSNLIVTVGTSATDGITPLGSETSGGSGLYELPAQFEFDVFVTGDTRTVGATRAYTMEYSATDSSANTATCTTVVTVTERDDCQDSPCQNSGLCTDLIADTFGYFEGGELRMAYDTEHYDGTIVRVGSEEIVAFSEWAAYVAANGAGSLGANIDPGYQCSCVRGWEGETCGQDVDECGAYECVNAANAPCSGPCENGATCTDSTVDSSIAINAYSCGCEGGFSGPNCQTLDECNPPGGLNPCEISSVALPSAGAHSTGLLPSDRRFLCPVAMVCTDPDHSTTDDYTCSCPSCRDAVFSESEVQELQVFFEEHLPYRRSIATLVLRQGDPNEVCAVPDLGGCTDPTAVNFDAEAAVDDGSCIAAVEGCMDETALNYDPSATVYSFATHRDSALQCKQAEAPTDECAADPCNSPEHRLCRQEVGRPGDEPGDGCADTRRAFHCDARFAGSGTQRFGEAFTCTDPNAYWDGDYICTCEYDTEDGDYADTYVHAATCGVDNAQTEAVENVLFENPYRPIADVPPKSDSPICIGTPDNAFTGCVHTAARPEYGQPETCIAQGFTDFGCVLTPGVDCSVNPDTGLPNGCRYIEEVAAVAEACETSATVVGTTTPEDSTRCVLTSTEDSGVTPGSCADVDSALATCEYVPGTYGEAGVEITADSCTSTLVSVAECGQQDLTGDDNAADQALCEGVTVAGLTDPCTYVSEVAPAPEQCTAPTYCGGSFTPGDSESCEGRLCAVLFQDVLNSPGATLDDAELACTAAGCNYHADECASLGKKMCPGDGACVDVDFLCVITNYDLTQLVKKDDEMFLFIMTRQRRPIHERAPTTDELAQWCPTEWAACEADATCAGEILVLLATPPTQAAIDGAGALAHALADCAIAAVETAYGALGDWASMGR